MPLLNPISHLRAIRDAVAVIYRYRQLTWEMAKREIGERYAGQFIGKAWSIGHPLIMMGVLVVIFNNVFQVGLTSEAGMDYTTYLLAGLIPWMSFQEVMGKAPVVITNNANLVKQVVFPLEVLPIKGVAASLLGHMVSLAALVIYVLVVKHGLPWTYFLLIPLVILQTMAMIGVACLFAVLGTYFRDFKELVQVFCFVGMYIMPLFYNFEMVPAAIKPLVYANPFTYLLLVYQDVCFHVDIKHPLAFGIFTFLSVTLFYGGVRVFQKMKNMFGNVL